MYFLVERLSLALSISRPSPADRPRVSIFWRTTSSRPTRIGVP